MSQRTIQPAAVRKTLTVKASPQRAFTVFTDGIDRWWPKTHTVGEAPLKQAVVEPREGGRWYGLSEAGVEDLWGHVLAWDPPKRLVLSWNINGRFRPDPSVHTEVELLFTDLGDGTTRIDFEHRGLENLGEGGDDARLRMDGGWVLILGAFQAAAET